MYSLIIYIDLPKTELTITERRLLREWIHERTKKHSKKNVLFLFNNTDYLPKIVEYCQQIGISSFVSHTAVEKYSGTNVLRFHLFMCDEVYYIRSRPEYWHDVVRLSGKTPQEIKYDD